MSSYRCARSWTAEAARDGRVSAAEKASFSSHAAVCAACSSEIRRLERVGDAIRAMRAKRPDELGLRRHRQKLLATLDSAATAPAPSRWYGLRAGIAVLFVVGTALAISLWSRGKPRAHVAPPLFTVHVQPLEARWSTHREGLTEVVVLEDGHLEIETSGREGEHRLLVRVPDGQIEDVGTRFAVLVRSERTESIEVFEGIVVFRTNGAPDRFVRAGEYWTRHLERGAQGNSSAPETAALAAEASPAASAAPVTNAPHASLATSGRSSDSPRSRRKSAERPRASEGTLVSGDSSASAGQAFAEAMMAFRLGQFAQAASAFEQFVNDFPTDPRGEDASFLRAVAHAKNGDTEGAARTAREYLVRYPHGLRRTEAERLVHPTAP